MEGRQQSGNGNKRHSGVFDASGQFIHRRVSKKSPVIDRQGQIYPEIFKEASVRAVTPEPTPSPAFDSTRATSTASSPSSSRGASSRTPFKERLGSDDSHHLIEGQRPRTRTLDERERKNSPTSKNRIRLGSPASSPVHEGTVSLSSIGFPSIITSAGFQSHRERLMKSPPKPLSPIPHYTGFLSGQGSPTTDKGRILQLMKTTVGRMQGILSFRTTATGSWLSSYCAINVATGSLIYQMKGDVSQAKTLIPDLRGCRVRTDIDLESQATFLEVCTRSSGLGIHLRPHVAETFDPWLAALLCWQPLPSKGVQNKMTKPQSSIAPISDSSRVEKSRQHSNSSPKGGPVIKKGKMLMWDHDAPLDTPLTPSRRISTYKQQRPTTGISWRKVLCQLRENGLLMVFQEQDDVPVASIVLSTLSRWAIQRLDASVLDDDFNLAIYPQCVASGETNECFRPIYLSLDCRVTLEVWFVLLRAFTVPELYGPELLTTTSRAQRSETDEERKSKSGMFRVERLLSIRLIDAKMYTPKAEAGQSSVSASKSVVGDYHAEVYLDGEVRSRSQVKFNTAQPFWREDFAFSDLPPVTSRATIVIKSPYGGQQDWKLISPSSEFDHVDPADLDAIGDIQVLPLSALYGLVDLQLCDLERGKDDERKWPIMNQLEEVVGEIYMKVRLEETVILMAQDYQPLLDTLLSFSNGLTLQLSKLLPHEPRRLPELFLDIFQVAGQTDEWFAYLIEDEIDGSIKATPATRFRYSRRIALNDSYEANVDREMHVRDLGKSAAVEANLLFRGNSLLTKALDLHMKRLGREYLEETLGESMRDIDESDPDCEVDPNKIQATEDLQLHWRNLIALTEIVWKSIHKSALTCPPELRLIFRRIHACVEDRYSNFHRTIAYSSVSSFLFLRFFCAAILTPKLFGLLKNHPRPRAQRTLTLIAKALQTLANLTTFGSKEHWMEPMNAFLNGNKTSFKQFIDEICSISHDRGTLPPHPDYSEPDIILARLPSSSYEGYPSLPYLIDQSRELAALVGLFAANNDSRLLANASEEVKRFGSICERLHLRTGNCFSQAEAADLPRDGYEIKWEELVEQMSRGAQLSPAVHLHHGVQHQPLHKPRKRLPSSLTQLGNLSVSDVADVPHTSDTSFDTFDPPMRSSSTRPWNTIPNSTAVGGESSDRHARSSSVWEPSTSYSSGGEEASLPSHALHWTTGDDEERVISRDTRARAFSERVHLRPVALTDEEDDDDDDEEIQEEDDVYLAGGGKPLGLNVTNVSRGVEEDSRERERRKERERERERAREMEREQREKDASKRVDVRWLKRRGKGVFRG